MAAKKKNGDPALPERDWSEVERVLKLMQRHGLEEFEFSDGEFHVRLKKAGAGSSAAFAVPISVPAEETPRPVPPAVPAPAAEPAPAAAEPAEQVHIVKSPIVGTYYGAPSPGAPPFTRVGDQVSSGQVLCIIEAMKLMNEIESDVSGQITRIFIENGQPVEYGEPLFAIRPSGPARPA
jgi:acetyl-CoA carboxylase biotin carboxyl carrier protein